MHHERAVAATSYLACFKPGGDGRNALRTWTGIGIQALQQASLLSSSSIILVLIKVDYAAHWNQLHFLLRNHFLLGQWYPEWFHHLRHHQCCQRLHDNSWYLGRRPIWKKGFTTHRSRRNGCLYVFSSVIFCVPARIDVVTFFTAQLIVAIVGNVISTGNLAGQRVLIAFVCFFIAFFAATWGPLAWVVTSEIYPQTIRGKVSLPISFDANILRTLLIRFYLYSACPCQLPLTGCSTLPSVTQHHILSTRVSLQIVAGKFSTETNDPSDF